MARSVAHANVTINGLLPGAFDTDRLRSNEAKRAEARGIDIATLRAERERAIPARRVGEPEEFGAACAFLCSAQAGYITGQSLLIDGGAFPARSSASHQTKKASIAAGLVRLFKSP